MGQASNAIMTRIAAAIGKFFSSGAKGCSQYSEGRRSAMTVKTAIIASCAAPTSAGRQRKSNSVPNSRSTAAAP